MLLLKKTTLIGLLLMVFVGEMTAQSIAINRSGQIADNSAILDLQSTEQGFLAPRMTTSQRTNISSPANGLLIFDVDTNSFWYYESNAWTELNSGVASLVEDADGNTKIQVEESPNENNIRFDTNGDESMVLTNEGKLGLGTSSPEGLLHVKTNAIAASQNTAASVTAFNTGMYGTSTVYQSFTSGQDGLLNTFTIYPNGIHACSGTITIYSGHGNNGANVLGSKAFSYNNTNNAPITFDFTDLNINLTSGNQYTVSFHALTNSMSHLGHTANLHTGGSYYSNIYNAPAGWDMQFTVVVGTPASGPQDIVISNDGRVGIRTAAPTYTLHVNGSVAGTSAYTNISDRRYKKDIQPLDNALEKILQLDGVSFDWRQEEFPKMNFSKGREIGFIAQDLKMVIPEIVNLDKGGYHSVEYANLVPVLVEAVKTLSGKLSLSDQKIEQQSAQISALSAEIKRRENHSPTSAVSLTNTKFENNNHE